MTAAARASRQQLAQHRRLPFGAAYSACVVTWKAEGRRVADGRPSMHRASTALLGADRSRGTAAVLGQSANDVLKLSRSFIGDCAALASAPNFSTCLEVGHVGPDRRKRRGVATGLGILREKCRQSAPRISDIVREDRLAPWPDRTAPRPWPFRHPVLVCAPTFHIELIGLACGDRIGLRGNSGDANRNGGNGEHGTKHRCSLPLERDRRPAFRTTPAAVCYSSKEAIVRRAGLGSRFGERGRRSPRSCAGLPQPTRPDAAPPAAALARGAAAAIQRHTT